MSGSKSAAEIVVAGRVQGVGYRNFAQRRASNLGLEGFVMNLKDGRVRARVEGPRPTIEKFIQELGKGPPLSRVEDADMAQAATELRQIQNSYEGGIAAGARLLQQSLLDFLK